MALKNTEIQTETQTERSEVRTQAVYFGEFLQNTCRLIGAEDLSAESKFTQLMIMAENGKGMFKTWLDGIITQLNLQKQWLDAQPENKALALLNDYFRGRLNQGLLDAPQEIIEYMNLQLNRIQYQEIVPGLAVLKAPAELWYKICDKFEVGGMALLGENVSFIFLPGEGARIDWSQIQSEMPDFIKRNVIKKRTQEDLLVHEAYHVIRELLQKQGVIPKVIEDPLFDRFQDELTAYILDHSGELGDFFLTGISPKCLCNTDNPEDLQRVTETRDKIHQVTKIANALNINGLELLQPITEAVSMDGTVNKLLEYIAKLPIKRGDVLAAAMKETHFNWSEEGYALNVPESQVAQVYLEKAGIKTSSSPTEAALFFAHQTRNEYTFYRIQNEASRYQVFAKEMMGQDVSRNMLFASWMQLQEFCSYESGLAIAQMELNNDMILISDLNDNWIEEYAMNNIYQAVFELEHPEEPKSLKYLQSFKTLLSGAPEIKASVVANFDTWMEKIRDAWGPRWDAGEVDRRKQLLIAIINERTV